MQSNVHSINSTALDRLKRCVHKISNLQKVAIEVVDMQTAKIELNFGLAKYILCGSA